MTTLENRFLQLKGEIEELKIIQDETFQILTKKKEMHDLTTEFERSEKNDEILNRTLSEYVEASFDFIRANNDIVKRISEKRKNEFEDEINKIQKEFNDLIESVISAGKKTWEIQHKSQKLISKANKVKDDNERKSLLSELKKVREESNYYIKNGKKLKEELYRIMGDLKNLGAKISIMTEGFDSLIEFLDGSRD